VFAQTAYWTEGFESSLLPQSGPTTPTVVQGDAGAWTFYFALKGTNVSYITTGAGDLRLVKPSTVTGGGGSGYCYAMAPALNNGVGKVTLSEGRGQPVAVEQSTNAGTTWTIAATVTCNPVKTPQTITINNSNVNRIRITNQTTGTGKDTVVDDVTITDYPATGVEPTNDGLPSRFFLAQNYPNPFNPSTSIQFGLPVRARISIAVYNLLGVKVATLASGDYEAGYHSVSWNAGQLSSGTYFYTLSSDKFSQTRKFILMK
jgi:hypothetical protein